MNRIVVKSLLILIAGLAIAFQAEAQGLKTKRLNTKALLAIAVVWPMLLVLKEKKNRK